MSDCEACRAGKPPKAPKAVKSQDCPFIKTCQESVVKEEWDLLCKDRDGPSEQSKLQSQMIHQQGHHCWEMCKRYVQNKVDAMEHRKPKDW